MANATMPLWLSPPMSVSFKWIFKAIFKIPFKIAFSGVASTGGRVGGGRHSTADRKENGKKLGKM